MTACAAVQRGHTRDPRALALGALLIDHSSRPPGVSATSLNCTSWVSHAGGCLHMHGGRFPGASHASWRRSSRVGMGRQHLTMVVKEKTGGSLSLLRMGQGINEANKQKKIKVGERPKVGKKRLPPEALEVVRTKFKKNPMAEIGAWGAPCMLWQREGRDSGVGTPSILSPSYSFCNTPLHRAMLVDMMGRRRRWRS